MSFFSSFSNDFEIPLFKLTIVLAFSSSEGHESHAYLTFRIVVFTFCVRFLSDFCIEKMVDLKKLSDIDLYGLIGVEIDADEKQVSTLNLG